MTSNFMTALLAVGLLASANGQNSTEEKASEGKAPAASAPSAAPPTEVSFITAESKTVETSFDYLGVVEASRIAEVRSRIEGYIEERLFEEGAVVERGQLLYRIEDDELRAEVAVAEAELAVAKSRAELAKSELSRERELQKSGAVSQENLDRASADYDSALANVALEEAQLVQAKTKLGYTEVRAPESGFIGVTVRDVGAYVDEGTNGFLTEISRVAPIYVTFGVSEKEYLKTRSEVESGELILADGIAQPSYEIVLRNGQTITGGELNFRSPDFTESTGTLEHRAEFPNEDRLLKPGQFVKVREVGWRRPNTITVPKRSVALSPNGAMVFPIDDNDVLQARPVTLGEWSGDDWKIESGVENGERTMVDGIMKARPGGKVKPVPYDPTKMKSSSEETPEKPEAIAAGNGKPRADS